MVCVTGWGHRFLKNQVHKRFFYLRDSPDVVNFFEGCGSQMHGFGVGRLGSALVYDAAVVAVSECKWLPDVSGSRVLRVASRLQPALSPQCTRPRGAEGTGTVPRRRSAKSGGRSPGVAYPVGYGKREIVGDPNPVGLVGAPGPLDRSPEGLAVVKPGCDNIRTKRPLSQLKTWIGRCQPKA